MGSDKKTDSTPVEVGAIQSASLKVEGFELDDMLERGATRNEIALMFAIYDLCFGKVGPKAHGPRIEERYYQLKEEPDLFGYIEKRKAELEAQRWN